MKGANDSTRGQPYTYTHDRWSSRWDQAVTQGSGPSPTLGFNANSQIASTGYNYDAARNMLSDGTNNYIYDAEGPRRREA